MELRQLRYFKVIADAESFARGAQDLHVAQPALSRSIAKLEEEIGHSLFVRHSAGVSLTVAGRRFYQHAEKVLSSVRDLMDGMASASTDLEGEIAVGAPHSSQTRFVLPVVSEFLISNPLCRIDLVQDTSGRLREQVSEGLIDMAILTNASESGLHYTPLARERICVICRPVDRDYFSEEARMEELFSIPLILTGYPDVLRLAIERAFPRQVGSLDMRCEVNSSSLLVDLVASGVGFGIAPASAISGRRGVDLELVPIETLDLSWSLAMRWNRRGLRAIVELEAALKRYVDKLIDSGEWPTAERVD